MHGGAADRGPGRRARRPPSRGRPALRRGPLRWSRVELCPAGCRSSRRAAGARPGRRVGGGVGAVGRATTAVRRSETGRVRWTSFVQSACSPGTGRAPTMVTGLAGVVEWISRRRGMGSEPDAGRLAASGASWLQPNGTPRWRLSIAARGLGSPGSDSRCNGWGSRFIPAPGEESRTTPRPRRAPLRRAGPAGRAAGSGRPRRAGRGTRRPARGPRSRPRWPGVHPRR